MSRYDAEKFETPPDPNLLCCICKCVMEGAVESPCRHAFCRTCISTWMNTRHNCPTCRKHLSLRDLIPILPIVQNIINRLVMFCDFRDKGCEEKICLENYVSHIERCKFGPVKCTHCHQMFRKHEVKEHEKTCQYCLIQCQKGCDQMVAVRNLPQHDCCQHLKSTIVGLKSKISDLENKIEEARERLERNNHNSDSDYLYDSDPEHSDFSYGSHSPYPINDDNSFEWRSLPESSVVNSQIPNIVVTIDTQSTSQTQTTNSGQSATRPVTIPGIMRTTQSNPPETSNQIFISRASARIQLTRPVETAPGLCNCLVSTLNALGNMVSIAENLRMPLSLTPYNPSRPEIEPRSRLELISRHYELPPAPQHETMFQQVLSLNVAGPSLHVPLPESVADNSMDMNSLVAEYGSPSPYQSEIEEVSIASEDSCATRSSRYNQQPSPTTLHDSSPDCEERNLYHDETVLSCSDIEATATISAANSLIDVTNNSPEDQAVSTTDVSISSEGERDGHGLGTWYYGTDEYNTRSSPLCECDYHKAAALQYVEEESTESMDNQSLSLISADASGTYDYGDDEAGSDSNSSSTIVSGVCSSTYDYGDDEAGSDYNSSSTIVSGVCSEDEQAPGFSPVSVMSKESTEHHVITEENVHDGGAFVSDEPTSSNSMVKETLRSSTDNKERSSQNNTIKRRKKYHTYDFSEHYMHYSNNALLGRQVCNSYTRNSVESEFTNVSCCTSTTNSVSTVCSTSTGDISFSNNSQQQYSSNDNNHTICISDVTCAASGFKRSTNANRQDKASGYDMSSYHQIGGKKRKVAACCSTSSSNNGTMDEDSRSQTIDDGSNVQEDNVINGHEACRAIVVSSAAVVVANSKSSSSNIEECSKNIYQNSPKHQKCTAIIKRDAKGNMKASGACSVSDVSCELRDESSAEERNLTDDGSGYSSDKDAIWSIPSSSDGENYD